MTQTQLARAMNIIILSGAASVVWQLVCAIQPLFTVFFQNWLGASAAQLGLLVTIIQLTGVFQIAGIFLWGKIGRQKPVFIIGHVLHRALTATIAFVAFYVARGGSTERGIVIIIVAMGLSWVFANSSSACWWGWVADIVPEGSRGSFFMKRSSILQIVNIAWFFLASTLLDVVPKSHTLVVFGVLISVGAASGLFDILIQLVTPEYPPENAPEFDPKVLFEPLQNRNFVSYSVAIGLAIFSMNLIGPFQSPYIVSRDHIGAPNTWLGIMSMLTQFIWVLVAPFWGTVMDRWGKKPVVIAGTLLVLPWAGFLVLTPANYFIVLPLIAIGLGLLAPAFWEGSNQMMLSLVPEKNRVSYVAWFLAIVGLVSAPGSLAGGALSDALKGVRVAVGPFSFGNFHMVQILSIVMGSLCAFAVARIREGKGERFSFVLGQLARPQIIATYRGLDSLGRSRSIESNAGILRKFDAKGGRLALKDIIERLDDPATAVQEEAARALGRIPSPASVDALILHLLDADSDIRVAAARSLGKIGDRKAVGALVGCLWEPNPELQKACLEALADIGDEDSIPHVMRFLRESQTDRMRQISSAAAARLGVYESAEEIFPSLLAARKPTARKQYALVMANLLGRHDEFYPYISGSLDVIQTRSAKLLSRFSANMQAVYARERKKMGNRIDVIEALRSALVEDRSEDALGEMIAFSRRLFSDLFGPQVTRDMLVRVDPKLGTFAWMMDRAEEYLANGERDEARRDTCRLVTLLAIYVLSEY